MALAEYDKLGPDRARCVMISELRFKNFKCLVDVQLSLTPFTVLVGANGCGKSSVLQAAHLLSLIGRPDVGQGQSSLMRFGAIFRDAWEPSRLRTARSKETVLLSETIQDGDTLSLEITVPQSGSATKSDGSKFAVSIAGKPGAAPLEASIRGSWPQLLSNKEQSELSATLGDQRIDAFASAAYLRLDAAMMTRTSVSEEEVPRMDENGQGLASTLAYLAGATPETLQQIASDLSRVVPGVRGIRTFREKIQTQEMEQLNVEGSRYGALSRVPAWAIDSQLSLITPATSPPISSVKARCSHSA
jgi:hypothetical protein